MLHLVSVNPPFVDDGSHSTTNHTVV